MFVLFLKGFGSSLKHWHRFPLASCRSLLSAFCFSFLVRKGGLEPPHLSVPDPKSGASANSATFAIKKAGVEDNIAIQRCRTASDDVRYADGLRCAVNFTIK